MDKIMVKREVILKGYRNEMVTALDNMIKAFSEREDFTATAYWEEFSSLFDIMQDVAEDAVGHPYFEIKGKMG